MSRSSSRWSPRASSSGRSTSGPRLSEQDYSSDDRRLLATLAAQAAPAIRVAQLVREQAAEAAERERYEQELKVAQLIQQQFLPRELPNLPEWQIAAYYGPARVVGGDFYDFIDLGEGRIGVVVGDVTDKGVPAALVMARTHSILRAEAPRLIEPGLVLARANELLAPEMPARMFVTCLYGVLEPATGRFVFANAGHNLPYVRTGGRRRSSSRATGLPLGPHARHRLRGDRGLRGPGRRRCCSTPTASSSSTAPAARCTASRACARRWRPTTPAAQLLDRLLDELHAFTGPGSEQEDDITLVDASPVGGRGRPRLVRGPGRGRARPATPWPRTMPPSEPLLAFTIEGAIGNERAAMQRVAEAVAPLGLEPARLERLKTAVAETVMNAIEYGSQGDPGVPVGRPRRRRRRRDPRPGHRRALSGPGPRRRDARPRRQARGPPEAPRLGPVPDPPHGRRHGRARRGRPADRDAHPRP